MATFLFFDLSAFSHFNNFRVVNFAWLIFQNIGDFGRGFPFLRPEYTGALFVITKMDEENYKRVLKKAQTKFLGKI